MNSPTGEFSDRIVVVTGASQGIGRATALAFASAGATVVAGCPALESEKHRQAVADWREEAGLPAERVAPVTADVSQVDEVVEFYNTVEKHFGRVDVLVNNAGINRDHTLAKMTDEEWR
ncbi:MAG: SDR family NAD(P)-dependent oxidoreductase, partial [Planctomycetaceae bacterium]